MLRFNELYITPDNNYLVIDVQVDDLDENGESSSNEYIDKIYIDTHRTFKELNPTGNSTEIYSNEPVYTPTPVRSFSVTEEPENQGEAGESEESNESEPSVTPSQNDSSSYITRLRKVVDLEGFSGNNIFLVRAVSATTDGEDPSGICSLNASETIGVAYDKCAIYNEILKKLKTISGCDIQDDVIDAILRLDAFEMSLKTGKYSEAIELWEDFFENNKSNHLSVNCGCHG